MIEVLFNRLKSMEESNRFSGKPYPPGLEPFSRRLLGQGFFPGGDGLWRDGDHAKMRAPSSYPFPKNGIMFLGNDFGSTIGFSKLKLHENPPTWRHLRIRLLHGNISGQLGFYTNAYLGLRNDRDALADPISLMEYDIFCKEFLEFQILTQAPRLIVVLGNRPTGLLHQVVQFPSVSIGELAQGKVLNLAPTVVTVSHPYSDLNKSDAAKIEEGNILARAWEFASK